MGAAQLRLLTGFYWSPARTASRLLDEGSGWAAVLFAVLMCLPFTVMMSGVDAWQVAPVLAMEQDGVPPQPLTPQLPSLSPQGLMALRIASSPLQTLLLLAAFCTPGLICAGTWAGRQAGGIGTLLQRDFGAACIGVLMAFAASHLPLALAGVWLLNQSLPAKQAGLALVGNVWLGSLALFAVFVAFVARALWGLTYSAAALCAGAGLAGGAGGAWVFPAIRPFFWMLGSPFVIFLLWGALQGDVMAIGNAFRGRANLRRRLEAAALNPHDADAQYQIGLLMAQRRQYAEAIQRFERAVQIDRDFAEAHFELGRIAREQNRLPAALEHLNRGLALDDKLQQHEAWREAGAAYLAAGRRDEAEAALRKFVDRRPHDSEGLYWLGEALRGTSQGAAEARELYQRAVESAVGAPPHRQREVRHWASLARKRLG